MGISVVVASRPNVAPEGELRTAKLADVVDLAGVSRAWGGRLAWCGAGVVQGRHTGWT